jgi:hypothetical protein
MLSTPLNQTLGEGLAALFNQAQFPLRQAPRVLLEFCLINYGPAGFDFKDLQNDVSHCLKILSHVRSTAHTEE